MGEPVMYRSVWLGGVGASPPSNSSAEDEAKDHTEHHVAKDDAENHPEDHAAASCQSTSFHDVPWGDLVMW